MTCLLLPCLLFFPREQHSISLDGLAHLDWHFMEVGQDAYWAGLGWWMQVGSVPCDQNFSNKWNVSVFKAVPQNRLYFYLGILLHIISSLFHHFCLLWNAISHKMLKLGFWNFKPIFLRMQFSLFEVFSSLVLVICLTWYLYLKLSHEIYNIYIIQYLEIKV